MIDKHSTVTDHRKLAEDYRKTFLATPHGKRVLEDLLQSCGFFGHVSGQVEEGMRRVAVSILAILDMNNLDRLVGLEKKGVGNLRLDVAMTLEQEDENG